MEHRGNGLQAPRTTTRIVVVHGRARREGRGGPRGAVPV